MQHIFLPVFGHVAGGPFHHVYAGVQKELAGIPIPDGIRFDEDCLSETDDFERKVLSDLNFKLEEVNANIEALVRYTADRLAFRKQEDEFISELIDRLYVMRTGYSRVLEPHAEEADDI